MNNYSPFEIVQAICYYLSCAIEKEIILSFTMKELLKRLVITILIAATVALFAVALSAGYLDEYSQMAL